MQRLQLPCVWASCNDHGQAAMRVTPVVRLQGAVVDTTGAGDAFVGGLLYGLCNGIPPPRMLALAAAVAAAKCTALGARAGLPHRGAILAELL